MSWLQRVISVVAPLPDDAKSTLDDAPPLYNLPPPPSAEFVPVNPLTFMSSVANKVVQVVAPESGGNESWSGTQSPQDRRQWWNQATQRWEQVHEKLAKIVAPLPHEAASPGEVLANLGYLSEGRQVEWQQPKVDWQTLQHSTTQMLTQVQNVVAPQYEATLRPGEVLTHIANSMQATAEPPVRPQYVGHSNYLVSQDASSVRHLQQQQLSAQHTFTLENDLMAGDDAPVVAGGSVTVTGPAWTQGQIERPLGQKDMGGWQAAVYTPEQQARLGVDEQGHAVPAHAAPVVAGGSVTVTGPAWTQGQIERPLGQKDMGGWQAAVYTPEQQARLGVDEQGHAVSSQVSEPSASSGVDFASWSEPSNVDPTPSAEQSSVQPSAATANGSGIDFSSWSEGAYEPLHLDLQPHDATQPEQSSSLSPSTELPKVNAGQEDAHDLADLFAAMPSPSATGMHSSQSSEPAAQTIEAIGESGVAPSLADNEAMVAKKQAARENLLAKVEELKKKKAAEAAAASQ